MKYLLLAIFLLLAACSTQQALPPIEYHSEAQIGQEPGLIAGTVSKYFEWDKNRFEQAIKGRKTIYLEFSANWCNTCKAQNEHLKAGFGELNNPDIVGFKIHYKDDQTTQEMEEMARQYGIAYQHTKVILKNGKVVLKSPEAWEHTRFLDEMKKLG